jgi:thiosulfate reductase cytochrome b subunit
MRRLEAKHPLAIRWMHWINFPVLTIMIWSGLIIYWAVEPHYYIDLGFFRFDFFPDWFYNWFGLGGRPYYGIAWHFTFMWFFALNGIAYVLYTLFSGEWRYLLPNRDTPREAFDVVLHDLGLRKEPLPRRKFNGAQRIAYTGIILMGAGSLLTGLAIYKPTQMAWVTTLMGGYEMARLGHFILTLGYVGFFVIHIVQVIKAGWNNFQAMVTGYEWVTVEGPAHGKR